MSCSTTPATRWSVPLRKPAWTKSGRCTKRTCTEPFPSFRPPCPCYGRKAAATFWAPPAAWDITPCRSSATTAPPSGRSRPSTRAWPPKWLRSASRSLSSSPALTPPSLAARNRCALQRAWRPTPTSSSTFSRAWGAWNAATRPRLRRRSLPWSTPRSRPCGCLPPQQL